MAANEIVETGPTQAVSIRDMTGSRSMPPREGRAMAATSLIIWRVSDMDVQETPILAVVDRVVACTLGSKSITGEGVDCSISS